MHGDPPPEVPVVVPHAQRPIASQVSLVPQETPQSPQFVVEYAVSHHGAPPAQSSRPELHTQARETQVAPVPQLFPHAPHVVLLSRLASQPLASLPSQLANPGLQLPMWQDPPEQLAVAFVRVHATPQPPQSLVVSSGRSQPSASLPLQSSKRLLQVWMAHVRVAHVAVAFAREHPVPQLPQSLVVLSGRSQPLLTLPSQLPNPGMQLGTHAPALHVQVAWPPEQTVVHEPQWLTSLAPTLSSQPSLPTLPRLELQSSQS